MPKIVEYPRASLANSLELAEAVSSLGGSCTAAMAAERLNRKQGGAFSALISAACKYGLLTSKGGKLTVQETFRDYKLAYNDIERRNALRAALLSPPMFQEIYERFESNTLPVEHFDKLLIREFDVPEDQASKVSNYFLEGLEQAELIKEGNQLVVLNGGPTEDEKENPTPEYSDSTSGRESPGPVQPKGTATSHSEYAITFRGPGLNSTISVEEEEDLLIVEAMLKKVKKALQARQSE